MLGAIAGDIIGSVHEFTATKTKKFDLFTYGSAFTDDTILTAAVARVQMNHGLDYTTLYREAYLLYPHAGWGGRFARWAEETSGYSPYNSLGNGSAMRVSPVAWRAPTLSAALQAAEHSAKPTHNHPEGIRGARAIAGAVWMARHGRSKETIEMFVRRQGYKIPPGGAAALRKTYVFTEECALTVPAAIVAFLDSDNFEDAIRTAISLGGDADTLACIAGSIAEAFYGGVPPAIAVEAFKRLDGHHQTIVAQFYAAYRVLHWLPHVERLSS